VGEHGKQDAEGRRCGPLQGDDGVGRKPREEGPRPLLPERRLGQAPGRAQALQPEAGREQGVGRKRQGLEDIPQKPLVALREGADEPPVCPAVGAETLGRLLERAVQAQGPAALEGMGKGDLGVDPFETEPLEPELTEEGRREGQGMDGGADVVDEAGEREGGRAGAAADRVRRLHEQDVPETPCERYGRGQAVGPGAHDDGIVMISRKGHGPSTFRLSLSAAAPAS